VTPDLLVPGRLGRDILYGWNDNDSAGLQLLLAPGKMLMGIHGLGKRRAFKESMDVGQPGDRGGFHGPLPERGNIQAQALTDAALRLFYFAVYLVNSQVDKTPRYLGQEDLEGELFIQLHPVLLGFQQTTRIDLDLPLDFFGQQGLRVYR
jgi:hypothetical protein